MLHSAAEVIARREALEELLSTDGWRLFVEYAKNEWRGNGYAARMGIALLTKDIVDAQVVHKTGTEIIRLLEWPAYQVRELKGHVENE